jgi:hypothetical protein
LWGKTHAGELLWKPLRHGRVLAVLHNPRYAGANLAAPRPVRGPPHELPGQGPDVASPARLADRASTPSRATHMGQFLRNQQRLDDNCTHRGKDRRAFAGGARAVAGPRAGGQCGRRTVRYTRNGLRPATSATRSTNNRGGRTCQFVRGDAVDARSPVWEAQPAHLSIAGHAGADRTRAPCRTPVAVALERAR